MAKTTLQLRRGTTSENNAFTGALGEVVVDTTRKTLVVHDGVNAGGSALATLVSPALTGTPTAPTQTSGNNSTRIATTAFVQDAISGFGAQPTDTDDLSEGTSNLYFTKDRVYSGLTAAGNISITQPGGPGTNVRISYSQPTDLGAFTNGPGYLTNANILASLSVTSTPSGALQYDQGTGIFTFTQAVASVNGYTNVITLNTDDISDSGRTNKWASSSTVRGYLASGTGLTYVSGTGTFSLSNTSITLNSKTISLTSGATQAVTTDDIPDTAATNKYFTTTLARAAFSQGTGVTITAGQVAIGQDVATSASPSFANVTATTNLTVNTNLIKTDASNSRVGINKTTPAYTLDVAGDINFTGKLRATGNAGVPGSALLSSGVSSFTTTSASGNGTIATIGFSTQISAPFAVGQQIVVQNVTPVGYNGTFTVIAVTTSSVSYANTTVGVQTVAGTVAAGQPYWASIADSLPEIIELDKIRAVRNAQSTWYGLISGTTYIDPEDALGTVGTGIFTAGMTLAPSIFTVNGANGSGLVNYSGSISGTTLTVTTQPVLGTPLASTSFASGGTVSTRTITMAASQTTNATYVNGITVTVSYSAGGTGGLRTFTVNTTSGVVVGASISGTGIPAGTVITDVNYLTNIITISNNLSAQASGSYTILVNFGAPGTNTFFVTSVNNIFVGQVVTGTGVPTGATVTAITGTLITISALLTAQATGSYTFQFNSLSGIVIGQFVAGTGIPAGTTVSAINAGTLTITISQDLTAQAAGFYNFYATPGRLIEGMGVDAQSYQAANTLQSGTYIITQLTSTASPVVQLSYASGGSSGTNSITLSTSANAAVGQLISGNGIPDGTFVTSITGNTVSFSKNLTTQASSTYNFFTAGNIGTYQINNTYATPITEMIMQSGVVTLSFDTLANNDLTGADNPYQLGQRISVTAIQPNVYNGTYIVTAVTPTSVSYASYATGSLIAPGNVQATMNGVCTITSVNQAILSNANINGTTLTIGSIVTGTVSIGQALFGPGIVNLYIVSGSGLSWTLNRNPGNLGDFVSLSASSYTVYPAQDVRATLINGVSGTVDGGNSYFLPTTNSSAVDVINPIQLQIVKNGQQLAPWLNNSGSVWQNVTPFGDYTVDASGHIVFSTPPQATDTINSTLLVGRSVNPVVKTYPFRAIDIMIGT